MAAHPHAPRRIAIAVIVVAAAASASAERAAQGSTGVAGLAPSVCTALQYIPWSPQVSFFCSWDAMDAWMRASGVAPGELACRNQPVQGWGPNTPNCYFTAGMLDLLLLRSAGAGFDPPPFMQPADVRSAARRAIWSAGDPFASPGRLPIQPWSQWRTGSVTRHSLARGYEIDAGVVAGVVSRVVWFSPSTPVGNRFAIYHEGHGGAAVDVGAATIDWLLDRGWQVVAIDMPLTGVNAADVRPGLQFHNDLEGFDDGRTSPLAAFLLPVKIVVDGIVGLSGATPPELLMIGRSGGGWTTYVYSAIDPRIDWAVPIAGGRPLSQRLDTANAADLGDYEQSVPHLYDAVGHAALMATAGRRGGLIVYNEFDPCCFRVAPGDPLVEYVADVAKRNGTNHRVFIDRENLDHSLGPRGLEALDDFLQRETRVPAPPASVSAEIRGRAVTLRWQPGAGADAASYVLEVGSGPGRADLLVVGTGGRDTLLRTDGVPDGTYYVRLRAASASGTSAPSSELVVSVGACPQPPAAPGRPRVTIGGAVRVEWTEPAAGCRPTGYVLEVGSREGAADVARFPLGRVTAVAGALPSAGDYYLRVRAINGRGEGAASGDVRARIY